MKVKALRGVCIGVDRHLTAGDTADLDPGLVTYLVNIKAVEAVKDEPAATAEPANPAPAATETLPTSDPQSVKKPETATQSTPVKPAGRRSSNAQ